MSTIPERLEKLRAKMQEKGIDIYIIPTADFHQSEYVGEHFKAREYITGFTGSAGTADPVNPVIYSLALKCSPTYSL